ncbi:glycoside hydrolase family 127 protein [Paenibacillus sp. MWE-103]|uniref:Glycoside hydrolase family 127 protein n=1 Tax=Paenibacillus artemisiicola TaxID=1172618 RepID=A0ABS3WJL1_9BACL|nr:beta-L-arabinofuranosidase domain-containing protein [Paenibacillus artemisiicola]MBO7748519.1 glycoside hydrolase family 127 protein [Paenibacillus artemisiicola]
MTKVQQPVRGWRGVPFSSVRIDDAFWRPRLEVLKNVTIDVCLRKCEETNRIRNFALAGGLAEGRFEGMYYNDSDVYKVLEGAAYALMTERDPALEAEIDRIAGLIEAAQEPDGYLSTYYTLEAPDRKWTDMEKHEMYNGGHLIEAAVAYYQATGKRRLLDVACRMADHYDAVFGPGKRHWAEGHEEIELALVKLFGATGEERYWKLALWLLEERGRGHGVGAIWDKPEWGPAYCQDDVPVRDIREVKGHAVRAMYLYTAMADVVLASGDPAYLAALDRVWAHTVERNLYVTGGIGPSVHNEGFTHDYDLPNESAYCETCAAIAMAFWNHRMNLLHGDGKYADLVERELFNGALSGISLSGDRFFYVNPLASKGEHHRVEWFHTSCCPTNLARFLPAIGQYLYAATEDGLAVNQYANGEAAVELVGGTGTVRIAQSTAYPWDGRVALTVTPEQEAPSEFAIRLRVPGWCRGYRVSAQGERVDGAEALTAKGYLVLKRRWAPGDTIELTLDMPVEVVRARPEAEADRGRIALQRGPVVYCVEQAGNAGLRYDGFALGAHEPFAVQHRAELLGGVTVLQGRTAEGEPCELVPYYAWDNREAGFMQVWVREAEDARLYRF